MQASFTYQGMKYRFIKYGKQLVQCKVHWLPAFVTDGTIGHIFKDFGKVVSIEHDTLKVGDFQTHSGVRVVT